MAFSMKLGADKRKKQKQYGLILPQKKDNKNKAASAFNVFASASGAESSNERDKKIKVAEKPASTTPKKTFQQLQVEQTHQQALAEDPSVFDYDGVYDELQTERNQKAQQQKAQREQDKQKPKYIKTLMEKAKIREIENERIRERRLLKEREAEDAMYGDKEKLVSASYKRKLMEMKKWDEEDARLQAQEDAQDVTKRGSEAMAGFYANLLTKNIAMGSDVHVNSKSAYTVGHKNSSARPKSSASSSLSKDPSALSATPPSSESTHPQAQAEQDQEETKDLEPVAKQARTTTMSDSTSDSSSIPKPAPPPPPPEEVISAARARFLARKAQKQQQLLP